jgi:BTB/POZ domain-containing protein KCTD9
MIFPAQAKPIVRRVQKNSMSLPRLSYLESCRLLNALDEHGEPPPIPVHMSRYDDCGPFGISFFRELLREQDFSNLTLPRTYFGHSEIERVSFLNTDLSGSSLCWNDFASVDFTGAILEGCDLRSSSFESVNFAGANLCSADMRRSWFNNCKFDAALMQGALLTREQGSQIALSGQQKLSINWQDEDGPEPGGGAVEPVLFG